MQKKSVASTGGLSPGLRRYFYFTAAMTGGCIMIVEILGAKMLSPYIGTSHFVWTAQIAVTLVALALGYYVGGRMVDRSTRVARLYWAILLAAVYLALTVAGSEPVAYWCLGLQPFALGSFVASLLLFFVPLALLAMVGPFFVRVLTSTVSDVGGTTGRLTAISTLGSFIGTMLIGYVLIPFLPNSWTMYLTALLLAGICAGYFIGWGRDRNATAPLVTAILVTLLSGAFGVYADRVRHSAAREKFYGNSDFGTLQVLQVGPWLYYLNDYLVQNTYDPQTKQSTSLFTHMLYGLGRVYTPGVQDVLCIGLGVGIVPMQFAADGAKVDVVEINPSVVPVAEKWFDLDPKKMNISIGDGRPFLNRCQKKYDVVALDAFLGDGSPGHLMTREAFQQMRRVLKPGGTLVINSFASFEQGRDFFGASLYKTLTNVFAEVRIHSAGGGNTFFVGAEHGLDRFVREPDYSTVHPRVRTEAEMAYAGQVSPEPGKSTIAHFVLRPENGRVLTDDYNPVEFYDVKNREEIRRNLAMSMKRPARGE